MRKYRFSRGDKKKKKPHLNLNRNPLEDQHPSQESSFSSPSSVAAQFKRPHHRRIPDKDYKVHFLPRVRRRLCSFTLFIVPYLLIISQLLLLLPVNATTATTTTTTTANESFAFSSTSVSMSAVHFRESGEPCTLDIECSESLICTQPPRAKYAYCDCDNKNYTWSNKLQKCVGLAGSVCTNSGNGDKMACVDNAYCNIKTEVGFGVCECTASYSPTSTRTCQLKFGYPCVNQNYQNLCNKDQLLNCIEDVCRCMFPNQMKYDKDWGRCRMLVGESCDPKSEWPEVVLNDDVNTEKRKIHIGCVRGARCVAKDEAGEYGECQLIEQPTTTTTSIPITKQTRSSRPEIRKPHHHHHQRKESIKNSPIEEDHEIPLLQPKASSSKSKSSKSSLTNKILILLLILSTFAR